MAGFESDETSERAKLLLSDGIKRCRKVVKDYQAALSKPARDEPDKNETP